MCFINKMDRVGADFYRCLGMIEDRLGANPIVLQLPVGSEADFLGVIDILNSVSLLITLSITIYNVQKLYLLLPFSLCLHSS